MPHQPTLEMIALGTLSHPFILGGLCASTSDPAFPRAFQQRSRLPQASVVREMLNSGRCLILAPDVTDWPAAARFFVGLAPAAGPTPGSSGATPGNFRSIRRKPFLSLQATAAAGNPWE
eukprot:tig00021692_g23134.t1